MKQFDDTLFVGVLEQAEIEAPLPNRMSNAKVFQNGALLRLVDVGPPQVPAQFTSFLKQRQRTTSPVKVFERPQLSHFASSTNDNDGGHDAARSRVAQREIAGTFIDDVIESVSILMNSLVSLSPHVSFDHEREEIVTLIREYVSNVYWIYDFQITRDMLCHPQTIFSNALAEAFLEDIFEIRD